MTGQPNQETAYEALVRICKDIESSGADHPDDYALLKAILQDIVVDAMFQVHENLGKRVGPADHNAYQTVGEMLDSLSHSPISSDSDARELFDILNDDSMRAVLDAHDQIARKSFEPVRYPLEPEPEPVPVPVPELHSQPNVPGDVPIRVITMRRAQNEPLGITVGNDDERPNELKVIRIAPGSATDKAGLLHVGDVILEVNGEPVYHSDDLGDVISRSGASIQFKVIPGGSDETGVFQRFLKAHFKYVPERESQALEFQQGDILGVYKDNDKNWWDCKNLRTGREGKIPSPDFQKRTQKQPQPQPDKQKSSLLCGLGKKKKKYTVNTMPKDPGPDVLYEDVILAKPFKHKLVVLVGAQGIGRRSIKNRIIQMRSRDFGAPVPNTSRSKRAGEEEGHNYHFLSRAEMDADIKAGKYLEYGELNSNYYGTSFNALKLVMDEGKTCIVDPKSAVLQKLRTVDWKPYVIFLKPSDEATLRRMNAQAIDAGVETQRKSDDDVRRIMDETKRIENKFIHLCDTTIPYEEFDNSCTKILEYLKKADTTPQWVPSKWEIGVDKMPLSDIV